MPRRLFLLVLFACLVSLSSLYVARSHVASAQTPTVENANAVQAAAGSGFTYQGRLLINGTPTSESHDFQFRLYDANSGGTALSTLTKQAVHVSEGAFTVLLDFGANAFNGEARWLEIAVRPAGSAEEYSTLAERQPLTPVPYALFALDTPPIAQVVWVAKSGGDFTSVQAALSSITDASASKPYLIKVAPGIYTERVILKPFVTVEGAGEEKTVIRWTGGTQELTVPTSATVAGASNAELRHLTLESDASGTANNHAVALWNASSPKLLHVTLRATGGTKSYGIFNNGSASPAMDNLTITASGASNSNTGIYNSNGASPRMTNVQVNASGNGSTNTAVHNYISSSPRMNDVRASASGDNGNNTAILNYTTSSPRMTNVQANVQGISSNNTGVHSYNFSFPRMNHVEVNVSGSGGTNHYGLYNSQSSSPVLDNVTIAVSGSSNTNYGVYNTASSDATMNDVMISVQNGSTSYGMQNSDSHPKMNNVVVDVSGRGTSYGMYNNSNAMPRMTNVTISATGGAGGSAYGVFNSSSSPLMNHVSIKAVSGTHNVAVHNLSSRPIMDNVTASAIGGTSNSAVSNNSSSVVTIRDSDLTGSNYSVFREHLSTVNVANSQLVGPVSAGVKCFNNYNANLDAVTCSP